MADDLPRDVNGTLPVSMKDRIPFTPASYEDGTSKPVYWLKPLSKRERSALFRELVRTSGMLVDAAEIRQALRDGAIAVLLPEDAAALCQTLEDIAAMTVAKGERSEEEAAHLDSLLAIVKRWQAKISREYPPLRELLAAQLDENEQWNLLTVRACIRDWEHLPAPCFKKNGLVTLEAMLAIPDEDLDALEQRCLGLRELTADQEPDFASP